MAFEPKILLTISMEGGTLIKGKREIRKWYLTKKELFPKQKFSQNEGSRVLKSGKYEYIPTKPEIIKKKIILCKEAYDYMTSSAMPDFYHDQKRWRKMSAIERLEIHLARICEHNNGIEFTYQIIKD